MQPGHEHGGNFYPFAWGKWDQGGLKGDHYMSFAMVEDEGVKSGRELTGWIGGRGNTMAIRGFGIEQEECWVGELSDGLMMGQRR